MYQMGVFEALVIYMYISSRYIHTVCTEKVTVTL